MRILKNLRYPAAGWIAGLGMVLFLTWLWPAIFPSLTNIERYEAPPIPLTVILMTSLVVATPAALIGGFIGSRIPREGGETEQTITAVLIGAILSIPFVCGSLWFFTGG